MSSRLRTLILAVAAVWAVPAFAAPVPSGGKYEPPTAVAQAANGQTILDQIKAFVSSVEPRAADEMDKAIAATLGEKMWAGLDLKKPIGGYAYIRPKLENSVAVLAVPITSEKEAVDLLERLQFAVEEEKSQKGLYRIRKRGFIDEDVAVRVKFHDGYGYVGVNADADELETAKLVPVKALLDDTEKATVAAKLFFDRCPKELKEAADTILAEGKRGVAQLDVRRPPDMPLSFPPLAKECLDWAERNMHASFADGETLTFRYMLDAKGGDVGTELRLTPKVGTKLAEDIAAIKSSTGRFHQLTTKDAVGGLWVAPHLPKALREKAGPFAADMLRMVEKEVPEPFQGVVGEVAKQLEAIITKGEVDAGLAAIGPNKDGFYTGVVAVGLTDPTALEKVIKDAVKGLPKEIQGIAKLDAEKAGDLNVHVITLPQVPDEVQKLIGKTAEVRVAFGAGAMYAAIGPDGLEQIKKAAALKPTTTKSADLLLNPAKMSKLLGEVAPPQVAPIFEQMMGKEDKLRSQFGIDVTGGKALTVTMSQYRLGLMGAWFGARIGFIP